MLPHDKNFDADAGTRSDIARVVNRPLPARAAWVAAVALFLITAALYGRAVRFDFVNYDDSRYVIDNPQIHIGLTTQTVRVAFTRVFYTNYSPLLIVAELTISSLFGAGPAGFHAANVLFHAANVALVFVLLRCLGGGFVVSCIGAAAWGWHPMRVESVAWISELKDVLCGFCSLLTLLAYLRYTRSPTVLRYLLVLALLAAALASKPMAVTLPFVLLLLDVYPLRRALDAELRPQKLRQIFIVTAEKFPMIAMSLAWARITVVSQRNTMSGFPYSVRLQNAAVSVADYLRDTVFPCHLAVFYPHPLLLKQNIPTWTFALSGVVLLLMTAAAMFLAWRRRPAALVGWLWFLGMLVPVLGIVQANEQSRADRNTYLPSLGLAFSLVWAASAWLSARPAARVRSVFLTLSIVAVLGTEVVVMERQLSTWQTSETLFVHAAAVTDDNYLAYIQLGNVRLLQGRAAEALALADQGLRIKPDSPFGRITRGLALKRLDRREEAVLAFRQALAIDPKDQEARHKLALLLVVMGRNADAEKQFKKLMTLDYDNAARHDDYAALLVVENRLPEAEQQWQQALRIEPDFANAHAGLAHIAHMKGDLPLAIAHYRAAVQNAAPPVKPQWLLDLAWLEATSPTTSIDEITDALARAKDAVPDPSSASPLALDTLAASLARAGQFDDAAAVAQKAAAGARSAGDIALANSIQNREAGYRVGRAYIAGR